jgi:hypothetical protein
MAELVKDSSAFLLSRLPLTGEIDVIIRSRACIMGDLPPLVLIVVVT